MSVSAYSKSHAWTGCGGTLSAPSAPHAGFDFPSVRGLLAARRRWGGAKMSIPIPLLGRPGLDGRCIFRSPSPAWGAALPSQRPDMCPPLPSPTGGHRVAPPCPKAAPPLAPGRAASRGRRADVSLERNTLFSAAGCGRIDGYFYHRHQSAQRGYGGCLPCLFGANFLERGQ